MEVIFERQEEQILAQKDKISKLMQLVEEYGRVTKQNNEVIKAVREEKDLMTKLVDKL